MADTAATSGDASDQASQATQAQAAATTTAQAAGAQTSQNDSATAQSSTDANSQQQTAITQSEVAALRKENANARQRIRALEGQINAAQQASMTDLERAQARVAELERQISEATIREQDRNVRLAAVEEATRLNFRSPDLAYRLIDRAEIDFDADGAPKNVAKLLKAIIDRAPELVKGSGADFGGGNRGQTAATPDFNAAIRRAAGRNAVQ